MFREQERRPLYSQHLPLYSPSPRLELANQSLIPNPAYVRRLYVKVSVDCAHKTFKAEFSTYKFDLLVADYAPPMGAQEHGMAAPAYGDLSGQLPTYQDAKVASGVVP